MVFVQYIEYFQIRKLSYMNNYMRKIYDVKCLLGYIINNGFCYNFIDKYIFSYNYFFM